MEHTHEEYKELTLKVIDNIAKALNNVRESVDKDYAREELIKLYKNVTDSVESLEANLKDYINSCPQPTSNKLSFGRTKSSADITELEKRYEQEEERLRNLYYSIQNSLKANISENTNHILTVYGNNINYFDSLNLYSKLDEIVKTSDKMLLPLIVDRPTTLTKLINAQLNRIKTFKQPLLDVIRACDAEIEKYNTYYYSNYNKKPYERVRDEFIEHKESYEQIEGKLERILEQVPEGM